MNIKWRNSLYYNKLERNGIAILACICILVFLLPKALPYIIPKEKTDFTTFKQEIEAFEQQFITANQKAVQEEGIENKQLFAFDPNIASEQILLQLGLSSSVIKTIIRYRNTGAKFKTKSDLKKIYGLKEQDYKRLYAFIEISAPKKRIRETATKELPKTLKKQLNPFSFNPNTADKKTLLALGLDARIVQTILNYRAKGGHFKEKTAFRKIYGLSESDYQTLLPYIDIPIQKRPLAQNANISKNIPQVFNDFSNIKIDINKANIEDWKKIKGIGEIYAKRIINFREKLGGFTSIEQIGTTYGVPDTLIQNRSEQFVLSPIYRTISINTISAETLQYHPYIKAKQAHIIINYRSNHGKFRNIDDLQKIKVLSTTFIERIKPYLVFE